MKWTPETLKRLYAAGSCILMLAVIIVTTLTLKPASLPAAGVEPGPSGLSEAPASTVSVSTAGRETGAPAEPMEPGFSGLSEAPASTAPACTAGRETGAPAELAPTGASSSTVTEEGDARLELQVLEGPTLTREFSPPFAAFTWTETNPYVFDLNGTRRALVSNSRSVMYDLAPGKSVMDQGAYIPGSAKFAAWPLNLNIQNNTPLPPESLLDGGFWRLVYYNAFGVYQQGENVYSILHGENKNIKVGSNYYRNTVRPSSIQYAPGDYTSDEGGENWENYFAFISMARSSVSTVERTGSLLEEEYGPVVWSVRPYIDSDHKQVSVGTRHPSYIIADGYLYLYYTDNIAPYTEKIHCARAKLDADGKPGPFYKLYNGEFSEPALPEGFRADDPRFFYKAGGRADIAVPSNNAIRFYPAKLKGTDYYIGLLEETVNGGPHQLKLLISKDLKTWTNSTLVPGSERASWGDALLLYPMINDSTFCAGAEVDPENFTLVGTTFRGGINGGWPTPQYLRLRIQIQ